MQLLRRDTALAAAAVYHFMSNPPENVPPGSEGDLDTEKNGYDVKVSADQCPDAEVQDGQLSSVPATYQVVVVDAMSDLLLHLRSTFLKWFVLFHFCEYQVIFLSGWAPHESQQVAKKRGSATVSFHDLQQKFNSK